MKNKNPPKKANPKANQKTQPTDSPTPPTALKPRNPVAHHPLLKKSHAHEKTKKAQRSQDKQKLRKQLRED